MLNEVRARPQPNGLGGGSSEHSEVGLGNKVRAMLQERGKSWMELYLGSIKRIHSRDCVIHT